MREITFEFAKEQIEKNSSPVPDGLKDIVENLPEEHRNIVPYAVPPIQKTRIC